MLSVNIGLENAVKFGLLIVLPLMAASPALADCRKGTMEEFFPEFAASIAVQEASVGDMVLLGALDTDAQPEPKMEKSLVPASELTWPVVPNLTSFINSGGKVTYEAVNATEQVVTLQGDSGYLLHLGFAGPCWELRSIIDESF